MQYIMQMEKHIRGNWNIWWYIALMHLLCSFVVPVEVERAHKVELEQAWGTGATTRRWLGEA